MLRIIALTIFSRPISFVIYIVALIIVLSIVLALYCCIHCSNRSRVRVAHAEGPVVTTISMPPVTGNQYSNGYEMNGVRAGGAWPAGTGPMPAHQQQLHMNNVFTPPPYPGTGGFNGQVQTAPYPVPNK